MFNRFGGDQVHTAPKYKGAAPKPAELRHMHEAWCAVSGHAAAEPCRRWSEIKSGGPRDGTGPRDNKDGRGREGQPGDAPVTPRYQRSPHFRAANEQALPLAPAPAPLLPPAPATAPVVAPLPATWNDAGG